MTNRATLTIRLDIDTEYSGDIDDARDMAQRTIDGLERHYLELLADRPDLAIGVTLSVEHHQVYDTITISKF